MAERGHGAIVVIGSWMAHVGHPFVGLYSATKTAEIQLARSWAAEFGPRGVRVNTVSPGATRTPINASDGDVIAHMTAGTPAGRPGPPRKSPTRWHGCSPSAPATSTAQRSPSTEASRRPVPLKSSVAGPCTERADHPASTRTEVTVMPQIAPAPRRSDTLPVTEVMDIRRPKAMAGREDEPVIRWVGVRIYSTDLRLLRRSRVRSFLVRLGEAWRWFGRHRGRRTRTCLPYSDRGRRLGCGDRTCPCQLRRGNPRSRVQRAEVVHPAERAGCSGAPARSGRDLRRGRPAW